MSASIAQWSITMCMRVCDAPVEFWRKILADDPTSFVCCCFFPTTNFFKWNLSSACRRHKKTNTFSVVLLMKTWYLSTVERLMIKIDGGVFLFGYPKPSIHRRGMGSFLLFYRKLINDDESKSTHTQNLDYIITAHYLAAFARRKKNMRSREGKNKTIWFDAIYYISSLHYRAICVFSILMILGSSIIVMCISTPFSDFKKKFKSAFAIIVALDFAFFSVNGEKIASRLERRRRQYPLCVHTLHSFIELCCRLATSSSYRLWYILYNLVSVKNIRFIILRSSIGTGKTRYGDCEEKTQALFSVFSVADSNFLENWEKILTKNSSRTSIFFPERI